MTVPAKQKSHQVIALTVDAPGGRHQSVVTGPHGDDVVGAVQAALGLMDSRSSPRPIKPFAPVIDTFMQP
jgi:hypothetical protein